MFNKTKPIKKSIHEAAKDVETILNAIEQQYPIQENSDDKGYIKALTVLREMIQKFYSLDLTQSYDVCKLKELYDFFVGKYKEIGSADKNNPNIHTIDITGTCSFLLAQQHYDTVKNFYSTYEPKLPYANKIVAGTIKLFWRGCVVLLDKNAQQEALLLKQRITEFEKSAKPPCDYSNSRISPSLS